MIPNFNLLDKEISVYMLSAVVGVFVILYFCWKSAQKRGLDEIHMLYMILFSFIGVLVGGHVLYGITNMPLIIDTLQNLLQFESFGAFFQRLGLIFGGAVFYGGLIGAILVCFAYLKRNKLPVGPYSDVGAVAIPLFHVFGRVGCFLSGCCYGIIWEHGFVYHHSLVEAANGVPRFPVQLVEAGCNLLLFAVLFACLKKGWLKNRLLAVYFSVYPVYRFLLEFLRGDEYRGFLGPLSTSQIISILLLLAAAFYWTVSARKSRHV